LAVNTNEGPATVGVISPGRYTFVAESEEHVSLITGSLTVRIPGKPERNVTTGESYIVPRQTSFDVEATDDVAYICYYR
jgi:uncharacterized protein YaiE (UPF0345 family)